MAVEEQAQTELEEISIDDPDVQAALGEYLGIAEEMKPKRERRKEIKAMALRRALEALPEGENTGRIRVGPFQLRVGHHTEKTVESKRKEGPSLVISEYKQRGRPRKGEAE